MGDLPGDIPLEDETDGTENERALDLSARSPSPAEALDLFVKALSPPGPTPSRGERWRDQVMGRVVSRCDVDVERIAATNRAMENGRWHREHAKQRTGPIL